MLPEALFMYFPFIRFPGILPINSLLNWVDEGAPPKLPSMQRVSTWSPGPLCSPAVSLSSPWYELWGRMCPWSLHCPLLFPGYYLCLCSFPVGAFVFNLWNTVNWSFPKSRPRSKDWSAGPPFGKVIPRNRVRQQGKWRREVVKADTQAAMRTYHCQWLSSTSWGPLERQGSCSIYPSASVLHELRVIFGCATSLAFVVALQEGCTNSLRGMEKTFRQISKERQVVKKAADNLPQIV